MQEESASAANLLSYYVSDSNGNDASSTLSDILPHLSAESDSELEFDETESIVSTNSASTSIVGLKSDIETAQILSYYTRNQASGGLSPHLTHENPHGFVAQNAPQRVTPDSGHSSSSAPSSAQTLSAEASADPVASAETDLRAALAGEQNRCSQLLDLLNQHLKDLDTLTSREEERRTAYARRMVQRASRQLVARAFCLLYGNVSISRQQHRALMKTRRAQLHAAFQLFFDQVWQLREQWVAVERVTREMQYRLQEAAWRAICHEGLARWAAALQLLWWQRWKAIIQRVHVQRRALCKLMRPWLRQAWRSWQDMTCWGQRACQDAESARARNCWRWAHRSLVQVWCRWRDWHAGITHMRQIGARILVRWQHSALCAALSTWQHSRLRLRRLREVAVKWRLGVFHRASAGAFDRWTGWAQGAKDRRADVASLMTKRRHKIQAAACQLWARLRAQRQQVRSVCGKAAARIQCRQAGAAWESWRRTVIARADKQHHLVQRVARLCALVSIWNEASRAACFYAWHDELARQAARARALDACARRRERVCQADALHHWLSSYARLKRLRGAAGQFVRRWMCLALGTAWACWRQRWGEHKKMCQARRAATRRLRNSALHPAFAGWSAATAEMRRWRHKTQLVMRKWMLHACVQVLTPWRQRAAQARRTRLILGKAVARLSRRCERGALHQLSLGVRALVHLRRRARAGASRWRKHALRRAILAWAARLCASRVSQRCRRSGALVVARALHRSLVVAFNSWLATMALLSRQRHLVRQALSKWRRRSKTRVLWQWRQLRETSARRRKLAHTVCARWIKRAASAALLLWEERAAELAKVRRVIVKVAARFRWRLLASAIGTWAEHVAGRQTMRGCRMRKAVSTWTRQAQRHAFCRWAQHLAEAHELAWKTEEVQQRTILSLTRTWHKTRRAAFVSWADHAAERRRSLQAARNVLARWTKATLPLMVAAWQERVYMSARCRHAERTIESRRWYKGPRSACISRWQQVLAERARARRVIGQLLGRSMRQTVSRVLQTWRSVAKAQVHQQHAMQKIVRQMLNRGRALAFGTWFAHVQETRGVRVMVKRQWHRTIAFCLDEWREFTTDEVSKARVMDRIVTRFQRRGLSLALDTWLVRMEEKHRCEELARLLLRRTAKRRLYSKAFARWCQQALEERTSFFQTNKLLAMATRWRNQAQARCMVAWSVHVEDEVRQRAILCKIVSRLRQRATSRAWGAWMAMVENEQLERSNEVRRQKLVARGLKRILDGRVTGAFAHWAAAVEVLSCCRAVMCSGLLRIRSWHKERAIVTNAFGWWRDQILVRMYTAAEQRLQACTNGTVTKPVTQSSDFNFIGEQLKVLEQQLSTLKNEL